MFDNAVIVHEKTNLREAGLTIEEVANAGLANKIPLRLEAVLGDELSLRLHAQLEDAERTPFA